MLISLNIDLRRIASIRIAIGGIEGIRIGFGALPVILAGIMFGPTAGGIVGAAGDMVGYYINPLAFKARILYILFAPALLQLIFSPFIFNDSMSHI